MNRTTTFWLLLVCMTKTSIHAASLRRAGAERKLFFQKAWSRIQVCEEIGARVYQTRKVGRLASMFGFIGAVKGSCTAVCDTLCVDYPSFQISNDSTCTCVKEESIPQCGTNAAWMTNETKCQCLPGFQGDAIINCTAMPVLKDRKDPCLTNNPCPSNQRCISSADEDDDNSVTCEPIKCANPFGNPCGPGGACLDRPTGYTCTKIFGPSICPAGCGPDSTCIAGKCECDRGFSRPNPTLGCVPIPKA